MKKVEMRYMVSEETRDLIKKMSDTLGVPPGEVVELMLKTSIARIKQFLVTQAPIEALRKKLFGAP